MASSVVGSIVGAIRSAVPALENRAYGHDRPELQDGSVTLPYAVAFDVGNTSEYHSKARHHVPSLIQVSVFASTMGRANELAEAIDSALTFAPLDVPGDAAVSSIRQTSAVRIPDQGKSARGEDINHLALTYRVILERPTPNKR